MALWIVRAGRYGEHEREFFDKNRLYLTWGGLENASLEGAKDYEEIKQLVQKKYADQSTHKAAHSAGQLWAFALGMKAGDLAITPRKQNKGLIAIGEVQGPYEYDPDGSPPMYRHSRRVQWIDTEIPRSDFDQDLLYSFGALMTICEVKRNEAEKRVRAMLQSEAKPVVKAKPQAGNSEPPPEEVDLEELARDQIAKTIIAKYKGHGMARLVDAILRAQGYTTHVSPPGPDKGVDILAAPGALGFGNPRLCVQVKSTDGPVDSPTLSQLIGTMQSVHADQGLLVSWGGFKTSVYQQVAVQFFKVRLWDQEALIAELLAHYDQMDPEIRAELPLKQIWTTAAHEEED